MKICMFVSNHISDDPRVKGEAEALAKAGHAVTVYGTPCKGLPIKENWNGAVLIRIAEKHVNIRKAVAVVITCFEWINKRENFLIAYQKIRSKQISKYYARYAMDENYDIFHAHDLDRLMIAGYCAEKTMKPLVYDSHEYFYMGYFVGERQKSEADIKRINQILDIQSGYIKKAKLVITVSEGIADALKKDYSLKDTPLVIYNCAEYRPHEKTNTLRGRYLHTENDRKIVLYQGGIQRGRGLERFVELAKRIADVDFVMIGPESQKEYADLIRKLAEGFGNLHILPPVPYSELWKITSSADFGYVYTEPINLCYEMAAPNKTFEYLAAGLPIFTIDSTGTRELIAKMPKENLPLFVLPQNIDDAATFVRHVMVSADIPRYVDVAYRVAETIFNRNIESRKLIYAYERLAE